MNGQISNKIFDLKIGLIFALLTIFYGFLLGGVFGGFEDQIKGYLNAEANKVYLEVYQSHTDNLVKVTKKSWTYIKRSHMHATGIGTTSLVLILLLSFLNTKVLVRKIAAIFLGLGGFGYSLFWLLAGMKAPLLGSTGLAKETLSWLAIPSSGMCILGVFGTMLLFVDEMLLSQKEK